MHHDQERFNKSMKVQKGREEILKEASEEILRQASVAQSKPWGKPLSGRTITPGMAAQILVQRRRDRLHKDMSNTTKTVTWKTPIIQP